MRAELRAQRDALLHKIKSRPAVMGVLNLTPDSFSDGGRFQALDAAVAHAKTMVAEGCDIVDIGGESTRPAAAPVPEAEELARVESVLSALVRLLDVPLSIDTYKAAVAARAAEIGAVVINDVWGLQRDAKMAAVVARSEAAVVITHNRAERDGSVDIFADMRRFFDRSLALAAQAGIRSEAIILDPGIGFGKSMAENLALINALPLFHALGQPLLLGASRKRLVGALSNEAAAHRRLGGSIALAVAGMQAGFQLLRVHDVHDTVQARNVWRGLRDAALTDFIGLAES
jgi:dihydropteroate synthase